LNVYSRYDSRSNHQSVWLELPLSSLEYGKTDDGRDRGYIYGWDKGRLDSGNAPVGPTYGKWP
jgi:hypothetical protein